ncbi:MAG: hypothetical protein AMXMBFR83_02190 [Phycisphaerae bacterium]
MSFLHPWLLGLGLPAVALPVVIHWLTRPRPRRLPISTLRFIQEAIRQRRAVHRLRDLLILGLRSAAVLLLVWAFARPLIGDRPLVSPGEAGEAARVVILDVSQSLAADVRGIQLFERARPAAAGYLAYVPGLRANLVLAGARPRAVFERPSSNLAALREALAEARVRPERIDAQAAITAASDMLAKAAGDAETRLELVIVSDFQRDNWSRVDFSVLPERTRIQLESVAPPETPANLAVLRVGSQGQAELGGAVTLEAEVGNYSPAPRQVRVEFTAGDGVYRAEGLCPPQARTTLTTTAVLQAGGWQTGRARLLNVEDALPEDDARPFVLDVRPGTVYALVTREPASQLASSSYYLERALVPARPRETRGTEKVIRVRPDQLDRDALAAADLVAVDHPGKLSAEHVALLAAFLQRGRSILYVAAEPVDAVNLKQLADAAGPALKMPVEFLPPSGPARKEQRWTFVRANLTPFSLFGDAVSAAVAPLRFNGGLNARPLPGALADDVLAAYGDSTAALVTATCGAATLAVLNADLPASNLPGSPLFVPMVGELVDRLLGGGRREETVFCGETVVVDLPPDAGPAAGLRVVPPEPAAETGALSDEPGGSVWRCPAVGGPGVYRVARGETTCFALAAAIPPEESDLRPLDANAFESGSGPGRPIHFLAHTGREDRRDSWWVWLAVACVACLLVEVLALRLLRT